MRHGWKLRVDPAADVDTKPEELTEEQQRDLILEAAKRYRGDGMSVVAEYTPPVDLDLEHKPRFVDSLSVNASYEIETQESYGLYDGCTHAVEVTTNRNRTHPTWRPSDLPKCREMWIGKNAVEVLTDSFEAYRYRPEILHLWCSEEELNVIKGRTW